MSGALEEHAAARRLLASRVSAMAERFRGAHEELREREALLGDALRGLGQEGAGEEIRASDEQALGLEDDDSFWRGVDDLPPLPEDLDPESVLGDEHLVDLVREFRRDPDRRLSGLETAEALDILAESRARREVLESRLRVATLEGAEMLRARGDYVEYARGEKYYSEPGVISFGEDFGERGMRIFYLFSEEFPELDEIRDDRRRVPEVGVRRLVRLIQGTEGG